jgi:outer membrane protein assembly factor BamB
MLNSVLLFSKSTENSKEKKIVLNKKLATITLVITLTFSMLTLGTYAVFAQEATVHYPTAAFITVNPNPIGVNQEATVIFWLASSPPQNTGADYYGWLLDVTIIAPNGDVDVREDIESNSLGSQAFLYYPDQVGDYTFQASFDGQTVEIYAGGMYTLAPGTYYFEPSESETVTLTVQSDAVEMPSETPLPTEYWENPISAENRGWYTIAGNWLKSKEVAKYTLGPESAQILWTQELDFGGIAGGESGWGQNYYLAPPYEHLFNSPTIISGKLYYNLYTSGGFGVSSSGVVCVDLRTGEEIWRNEDMTSITCGQTLTYNGANGHGVKAYLWAISSGNLMMYDAFSGRLVSTIEGAGFSFSPYYGPNGELLVYSIANNRLTVWNSTKALSDPTAVQWSAQSWRPPATAPYSNGIQLNVSIPEVAGGTIGLSSVDLDTGIILAEAKITATMDTTNPTFTQLGYDAETGAELWREDRTGYGWGFSGQISPGLGGIKLAVSEGKYAFFEKETTQWHVFSLTTGDALWSTEPLVTYTNTGYSMYDWESIIADGVFYTYGYSGCVVAFDLDTGDHLWTYSQGSSEFMTPYGSWPSLECAIVADGKFYLPTNEHTPNTPLLKGYKLRCIDITNGEEVWNVSGFFFNLAIADGILVGWNGYDNQIYAFGKAATQTTVTAPDVAVTQDSAIIIRGTVTDICSGTETTLLSSRYPNGVPAISDEDHTVWMEYLYEQQDKPEDAVGVQVLVKILDPNGDWSSEVVTTDSNGVFSLMWCSSVVGEHHVTAIFEGSNSYYTSQATTTFGVEEQAGSGYSGPSAEEIAQETANQMPAYSTIDLVVIVLVVIAIIIGVYGLIKKK